MKLDDWPVVGKTAKGVVFYVDQSGQHGWAVSVTESQKMWCNTNVDISDLPNYTNWIPAISDFNGYENTQIILNTADANTSFPAVDYVMGLGSIGGHDWYLPAVGQLNVLFGSILAVNQSLGQVGTAISYLSTVHLWSSTETNADRAMIIQCDNGWVSHDSKNRSNRVRAIIDF